MSHKKIANRDRQRQPCMVRANLHTQCMCVFILSMCVCVCVSMSVCFNSHSQRTSVRRSANWPSYKYRGGCSQIGKKGNRLQSDTRLLSVTVLSIRQQLKSGNWNKNKENRIQNKGKIVA